MITLFFGPEGHMSYSLTPCTSFHYSWEYNKAGMDSVLAPSPWSGVGPLILAFHWTHVSYFSFSHCIALSETLLVEPDLTLTGKDTSSLCCCCSVAQSCPTLCDPMGCSMPGFPVLHHLPELAQTQVHWISDPIPTILFSVIPFSSCIQSFPASGSLLMSQLFTSGGQSIGASASASVMFIEVNMISGVPLSTDNWGQEFLNG